MDLTGSGSPPRMRGKRFDDLFKIIGYRITPADAGKTYVSSVLLIDARDHPRGCGENLPSHPKARGIWGSPPRMRGKRTCVIIHGAGHRITPADAGKTIPLDIF